MHPLTVATDTVATATLSTASAADTLSFIALATASLATAVTAVALAAATLATALLPAADAAALLWMQPSSSPHGVGGPGDGWSWPPTAGAGNGGRVRGRREEGRSPDSRRRRDEVNRVARAGRVDYVLRTRGG